MDNRWFVFLGSLCLVSKVFAAAAVANAPTANGFAYYFVGSQPTAAKAREMALRNCRKDGGHGKCSIQASDSGPMYWAVFHARNGSVGLGRSADRQSAIDTAYAECSKLGECSTEAAHVWFDEGQHQKVAVAPAPSDNCQPPNGKVIRYQYSCNNGDCVRRYENGCTVPFQAPYCYDPAQQKWDWKPDGC